MSGAPETLMDGRPYDVRQARIVLGILAGMALMVTYVETMVLPAFSQFYTFFDQTGGSFSNIAWILSAYLLVGVVVTPIFGKLGDLYGKKRMLLVAMTVYGIAVSLAGFTPNIGSFFGVSRPNQLYLLIAVRALQGTGMAMFPLGFAMIPEVFPGRRVGQAQGILSGMFAAGASMGLVGGGYLAQTYGWPATYHTVIPIAIALLIAAWLLLKESTRTANPSLDFPGVASLGFGLATLMFAISEGSAWGWTSFSAVTWDGVPWGVPQFILLAVVGFAFFAFWEQRAKSPVISFAALRARNIWVSNVTGVVAGLLMFLVFTTEIVLIELPFGPGFNQGELQAGLIALPWSLSMLAFGPFLGRAVARFGPKPIMTLGFALCAVGATSLIAFNRSLLDMAVLPIFLMVGNVGVLISMSNTIVLSADRRELGIQTGMNQTFRNLGSAVAPVLVTSILASYLGTYYLTVAGPSGPISVPFRGYDLTGFEVVYALTAALAVVGVIFTLAMRNFRYLQDGSRTTASGPAETSHAISAPHPVATTAPRP
ncbi:MAG: MFS transporter [Thermoplasmata archaeon]|nr:MFS transporter [Thermoplasmata archaeon]